MSCRMFPFLMTLWRSVSGETGRNVFQAKCLRIVAARDLCEFFFGPGKTHPCTRTRDKCPGRCSPCEDRAVVRCSRDWRTTVETLSHGMCAARPSDPGKRRRSSSPPPSPCFSCLSPSIRSRMPVERRVNKSLDNDNLSNRFPLQPEYVLRVLNRCYA